MVYFESVSENFEVCNSLPGIVMKAKKNITNRNHFFGIIFTWMCVQKQGLSLIFAVEKTPSFGGAVDL